MLGKFMIAGIITAAIIGSTAQIILPPKPVLLTILAPARRLDGTASALTSP